MICQKQGGENLSTYHIYPNIEQAFFPNYSSEEWVGYFKITHRIEPVLYRHFPEE
jgi:hypothetical protein